MKVGEYPSRPYRIPPQDFTAEQAALVERIISGPRREIPVNQEIWLHNPPFAQVAERFGAYVSQLAPMDRRVKEIVILTIASVWQSGFEQYWHEQMGQQCGLSAAQITALREKTPVRFDNPVEQVSYDIAFAVAIGLDVPDELHHRAMTVLGHSGVSDIIGLMGLYSMIAWTISFYRVPVPDEKA